MPWCSLTDFAELHVWSLVGGNALGRTLPPVDAADRQLYYLPTSGVLADEWWTGVWALDGDAYAPVDFGMADVRSVAAAPTDEGDRAFVIDAAGVGTIHELPSGELVGPAFEVGPDAGAGIVTHDGRHVVAQASGGIVVFDATTGAVLGEFEHGLPLSQRLSVVGHLAGVVGTGPGGTGDNDTLLIVDLTTMEQVFLGDGYLSSLAADGNGFFRTLDGLEAELVDLRGGDGWPLGGAVVANLLPSEDYVVSYFQDVSFHTYPDGEPVGPSIAGNGVMPWADGILTQLRNGRVHVWNTDVADWPDIACEAAGRNLTRDEWEAHMPPDIPYEPSCPQWPVDV